MRRIPALFATLLGVLCIQGIARCADLLGRLNDNHGHPLSNILVHAWLWTDTDTLDFDEWTDESGAFSFSGDAGFWALNVPLEQLNGRGYFSVGSASIQITNQSRIRLTTRKLEFTHRIAGRLFDETGQPLAGYSLLAGISENSARFQTNVTTGADGSFAVAAVPAVWDLCCLSPPPGTSSQRVFPGCVVEVTENNIESHTNLVAPLATSTIIVNTTNLVGWDIVASAEAGGGPYRLVQSVPYLYPSSPVSFSVFDGLWTLSAMNRPTVFDTRQTKPPEAVVVAVTNGVVTTNLAATLHQNPTQVQRVRTLTASGTPVTNVNIYATSIPSERIVFLLPLLQLPGMNPPEFHDLQLEAGRWRIEVSTPWANSGYGLRVEREILIASNSPPPDLSLVFPEPGVSPRISGNVRNQAGLGLPGKQVYLNMSNGGTNHSLQLITDDSGAFGTDCLPGRWTVRAYSDFCSVSSVVVVSNHDELVSLDSCPPPIPATRAVNADVHDESGPFKPDASINFLSWLETVATNTASLPASLPLRAGLWSVSVLRDWQVEGADPYSLIPTLKWQLGPGTGATSLVLVTRLASARIRGQLRDEQGRLLTSGYAAAWTSLNGTNYSVYSGIASGYFSMNVFPGTWEVAASVTSIPSPGIPAAGIPFFYALQPESIYTTPPAKRVMVTSEVARCDFVLTNLSAPQVVDLTVKVIRDTGEALPDAPVYSSVLDTDYALLTGANQWGKTDSDGLLKLARIPRGSYSLTAYDPNLGQGDATLLAPTISYNASSPSNVAILILRNATMCLSGTISNAPGIPFPMDWNAQSQINGTNYFSTAANDATGHFCIPVFPGTWTLRTDDLALNDNGFQSFAPREVNVPSSGLPDLISFVPESIAGDFREAHLLPPVALPDGRLRLELRAPVALSWRIERSGNLKDWTPVGIQTVTNGSLTIYDRPSPPQSTFYRATWVK